MRNPELYHLLDRIRCEPGPEQDRAIREYHDVAASLGECTAERECTACMMLAPGGPVDVAWLRRWLRSTPLVTGPETPTEFRMRAIAPRIQCADGFSVSVQAGSIHYCIPRGFPFDSAETGFDADWVAFELGYPNRPCPELADWLVRDEQPEPDESGMIRTVYAYVPGMHVIALLNRHGGRSTLSTASTV